MGKTVYLLLLAFYVASTQVIAQSVSVDPYDPHAHRAYMFAVTRAGAVPISPLSASGAEYLPLHGRFGLYTLHYRARYSSFPFVRKCRARVRWPPRGPMIAYYDTPYCAPGSGIF